MMEFITTDHMLRYRQYVDRDQTNSKDVERLSMFYILASYESRPIDSIYDFDDHSIHPKILDSGLSHGESILIRVAFHLFNGWECDDILDIFSTLSGELREVILGAIRIRFNF